MSIEFANYGQERERNATESELEIFKMLQQMSNPEHLELVRVCDDYVTARLGEWDLARIKYTPRAKWVIFPTAEAKNVKHRIESVGDVAGFGEMVAKSIEIIKKYV